MKLFLNIAAFIILALFGVVAAIKFIQKCSWRDAVGILEELCKEWCASCRCCHSDAAESEEEGV